jgi:hypothetical protein
MEDMTMWRKLGFAGALAHVGTIAYSVLSGAAQIDLFGLLYAGMYAVGPGLVGVAAYLLVRTISPPVRPMLVLESATEIAAENGGSAVLFTR